MSHDFLLNNPVIDILVKYPDVVRVLDVGAGYGSWGQVIRAGLNKNINLVAIEKYPESCERLRNTGMYSEVICDDALNLLDYFTEGSFDVVLASQVIEHFEKDDGFSLIRIMKSLASQLVIICTPRGYMHVSAEGNPNIYERHLSGWIEDDFRGLDFETSVLDMRATTRSIRLVDDVRRFIFRLYDPHQIIAIWDTRMCARARAELVEAESVLDVMTETEGILPSVRS